MKARPHFLHTETPAVRPRGGIHSLRMLRQILQSLAAMAAMIGGTGHDAAPTTR
jgi:hypothetical protein